MKSESGPTWPMSMRHYARKPRVIPESDFSGSPGTPSKRVSVDGNAELFRQVFVASDWHWKRMAAFTIDLSELTVKIECRMRTSDEYNADEGTSAKIHGVASANVHKFQTFEALEEFYRENVGDLLDDGFRGKDCEGKSALFDGLTNHIIGIVPKS